jgi:NADH-quinone oxidoreductase subunit A
MLIFTYSNILNLNILFYIAFSFSFAILLTGICQLLNTFLHRSNYIVSFNAQKSIQYECGFDPFSGAAKPIEVRFYLIAVLFLVFDLEIIILIPLLFYIQNNNMIDILIFYFFLFLVGIGYIYEVKSGCLSW